MAAGDHRAEAEPVQKAEERQEGTGRQCLEGNAIAHENPSSSRGALQLGGRRGT